MPVHEQQADRTMGTRPADSTRGRIEESYHAAIQHDLVDLSGDERLVGVVRRPTPWFSGTVDENRPALGPPADLLDEVKTSTEDLKMQGLCDEGAHNAAWDEVDFEARYRTYLDDSAAAQEAMDDLLESVRGGETIVLVCFEADNKRCHRHALRSVLEERLDASDEELA